MRTSAANHLADIKAGKVTKTNIIGLRRSLNADWRRVRGYSVSLVAPKLRGPELLQCLKALKKYEPRVVGSLHDSGLARLRAPRYRKRLASVQSVIDSLVSFHLVSFDPIGRNGENVVPVFRAKGKGGKSFLFRNVPWQSGGDGPEILESL
jgi:hypothetical protein